ncbi:SEC-C metal-binding domain-containing protein [Hymenobacter armeniacus]|uniref:SEC-C domain-containing protein n=1 Tax=Hymenobacter armeniacus TaxID=2771358 RepID=A0ABR8JUG0_9BACT|nr:SEC-C metal-binding domain-containing protein [Hymenobacter armeniacus]MBD2722215.1 SEC-C domain-containing protein [Hymenobacter armeniacus]
MSKHPRNSKCWCGSGLKYKKCCHPEIEPSSRYIQRQVPENSMGTQPIKVLENNVIHFFEETNPTFRAQLEYDTNNLELKNGIKYINEEKRIDDDLAYINSNKQIHIQETFLSYIWILSYSLVTMFDEHVMLPRLKRGYFSDPVKLNAKFDFLNYGLSLINRYSVWNIEKFPNPQKYLISDKVNIEKTNSVFLHAANFVLCHEYSHFSLGHVDRSIELMVDNKKISGEESVKTESEADFNAISLMLKQPKTKRNRKNIEHGIVAGGLFTDFFG